VEIGNVTLVYQLYLRKSLDKPLTTTEIEALQAVADGDRSSDVAVSRGITEASVKNLIWKACQKLGADGRAHAVALGFRKEILR
jgi:DNA-binding CsgD family transcriptional regulator